jgi:hypothetical protein
MAEEGKGIALAILGIVAVIAVVGLVLLFKGAIGQGVYGGHVLTGDTGPGFQYLGEGAYVSQQRGECLSNEFFAQNPIDSFVCRPGIRPEEYQRSRKFFGAPNQQVVVDGYCCLTPNARVPTGE